MTAVANVTQDTFDRIWDSGQRFVGLAGPDVSGNQIEIRTPMYTRYMTGLATEYEDGVLTVEIFLRMN